MAHLTRVGRMEQVMEYTLVMIVRPGAESAMRCQRLERRQMYLSTPA